MSSIRPMLPCKLQVGIMQCLFYLNVKLDFMILVDEPAKII